MGPPVILLIAGLIASLVAWLTTGGGRPFPKQLVGPLYLASIAVQTCHFVEEYAGRLYEILPPLFNLSPLPAQKFVVFNLVWIGIFLVSAVGVFRRVRLALLPVWFQGGGYTPGVVTALVNLPFGVALVVLLTRPTAPIIGDEAPEDSA
jgi:hypothetical protein